MAENACIPKFEKRENDGNVPYTQYFDKVRKGKTSTKLINPNDPVQNPDAFYSEDISFDSSPSRPLAGEGSARVKLTRHRSREEAIKQKAMSLRNKEASSAQRRALDQPKWRHEQGQTGDHQRRTSQSNNGHESSVERPPLHPHVHVRAASKGGSFSPSRKGRSSSEKHGLAPSTPGRSKPKLGEGRHSSGSAVPKFGEWDVMDPASADNYSYIFNQLREEKQSGNKIPSISSNGQRRKMRSESTGLCCSCFKY